MNALFWSARGFVLVMAAAVGTVVADPSAERPTYVADTSVLAAAPMDLLAGGCSYTCRTCGENQHDIVTSTRNNAQSNHLENCNAGDCDAHSCGGKAGAVDNGALPAVQYNRDRELMQVLCAEGTVVASIPMSEEQFALRTAE